mmetsp:Transcript_34028/g.33200  ORF Transcript_34028/g.33200 Transcript_34028/m.33200 type:complete len:134 (-) Transcript_34028:771-1172(-)
MDVSYWQFNATVVRADQDESHYSYDHPIQETDFIRVELKNLSFLAFADVSLTIWGLEVLNLKQFAINDMEISFDLTFHESEGRVRSTIENFSMTNDKDYIDFKFSTNIFFIVIAQLAKPFMKLGLMKTFEYAA